ncbi:MAG: nucleoside triphosphate pyrophosphohydrolase [Deltaproteobacteria bacterium]|nr:nucleoside triphosphate pyrophosphohydrolase [Deltaproteobacteria bacterium]
MAENEFKRLTEVVDRLLSKDGCKWDRSQNFSTLRGFVLEEALELIDALDRGDTEEIEEELGDILYHIIFISRLTGKKDSLKRAISGITEKLIRRHPHIFENRKKMRSGEVVREWERIKIREKNADSIGYGLLPSFTALISAYKLGVRSCSFNFDWKNVQQVFEKLDEETGELKSELRKKRKDRRAIESEIGDILFVVANIARHLGVNPEIALMKTNRKFIRRFDRMYRMVQQENKDIKEMDVNELEYYWQRAKKADSRCFQKKTSD